MPNQTTRHLLLPPGLALPTSQPGMLSPFPGLAPPRLKAPLSSRLPPPWIPAPASWAGRPPLAGHIQPAGNLFRNTATHPHHRRISQRRGQRRGRPMKPPPPPLQGWLPGAGAAAVPRERRPSAHPPPGPGAEGHVQALRPPSHPSESERLLSGAACSAPSAHALLESVPPSPRSPCRPLQGAREPGWD